MGLGAHYAKLRAFVGRYRYSGGGGGGGGGGTGAMMSLGALAWGASLCVFWVVVLVLCD